MRISFCAIPGYGHIFPLVPLAVAAVAGGHEVSFAASSLFAEQLPGRAVQGIPEGMTLGDAEREARAEIQDPSDPFAWPTALFGIVMPRHVVPRLLADWAQAGRPDLVIHDETNVGAAIAAAQAGIPAVGFKLALAESDYFLRKLQSVADSPSGPTLDPTPPSWRGSAAPDSPDRIPIRSIAWSDPKTTIPEWLIDDAPGRTAYLTLGTVAFGAVEILRRSILETATRCSRVLVAAGPESDPAALSELPTHVQVERYLDQAHVLTHVDVAIHHGGSGTTLGCLAAGVPQVITPQGADQFHNADRLAELGLGVAVMNDAKPGAVAAAVDGVLGDGDLRRRLRTVREDIAAMPHPDDVLTTLLARFCP